jgi:hypothetical protein
MIWVSLSYIFLVFANAFALHVYNHKQRETPFFITYACLVITELIVFSIMYFLQYSRYWVSRYPSAVQRPSAQAHGLELGV